MPSFKSNILTLLLLLLSFSPKAQKFYKTPSGAKYHLAGCRMVKNVSEEITVAQIRELGLGPCSFCKPGNVYGTSAPATKKPQGQDQTVQCKGFTKAGTRCQHMTRIANGYCFQHQPR